MNEKDRLYLRHIQEAISWIEQYARIAWIPAFAGLTKRGKFILLELFRHGLIRLRRTVLLKFISLCPL